MIKLLLLLFPIITYASLILTDPTFSVPSGTTIARPDCTTLTNCFRFNEDLDIFEGWDGVDWGQIGGSALGNWVTASNYKIGDTVVYPPESNDIFRALADHISAAAFNTDRLAGNWEKISPTTFKMFTPGIQYFTGDLIKTFDEQLFLARVNFIADADPVVDIALRNMEFRSPNDLTTAPLRGGIVAYAAPNYTVTAGNGIIVTSGGTPFSQINPVTWNAATLTLPNPTGYNTIQVSGTGVVSAVSGINTPLASRQNIVLAIIFAPTNDIMPRGGAAVDHGNDVRTLSLFVGIVKNGMIFTGNANQTFITTSGSIFFDGIGKGTDTPNLKNCPAQPVTSFRLYDRNTDLGLATNVPTSQYDVGGAQTAIPGTNWGYHKIFLAPNCQIILQYGQDIAASKNEITVLEDNNRDAYVVNPLLEGIVKFIGVVYFQSGNVNLADSAKTSWENSGLFGIGTAGSGSAITATGDILGPAASIDNHPLIFDGTTGKLAKDSSFTTFNLDGSVLFQGPTPHLIVDAPSKDADYKPDGITFTDTATTFSLSLLSAPIPTGNQTITFPPNPPVANQILQADAFGQLSWVPGGSLTNWQGTHAYVVGETVVSPIDSNDIFRALLAHTSTASFTVDRLAGNWEMISPSHFIPFTPTKQYFTNDLIRTNDGHIYIATANFVAAVTPATDIAAGRMELLSPADYTTSVTSGGVVTFGANYAITAGTGFIVTNGGTPFSTIADVTWVATNIAEPLPNATGYNTIYVSSAGLVSAASGLDTPASAKTSIVLATIFAPTRSIIPRNGPATDHGNTNRSLSLILGMLKDKIEFTGNADNTFQTKAGSIYLDGIAPGTEQPNIKDCPVQITTNFNYYDRDTTISTNQTLLDTYNYDLNGNMTTIPVGQWSYSKIFLGPNCRVFVQHGQDIAASEAAITSAELAGRNSYVTNPALTVGVKFVGLVFFQAQTNVMTEGPLVTWVNSGLLGMGVAGSGSSVTTNGDVFGPATSTDNTIARFDGGSGKILLDSLVTLDDAGSISDIRNLSVKGLNTNAQSTTNVAAVNFATGRNSSMATIAGQTSADISFGYGNGDWRHFIATTHDGNAGTLINNSFRFYVQNSTSATTSASPNGTGNVMSMAITPYGTGILTTTPYAALDVDGDIITSFHGNASQHNAAELGTRAIGHVSGNSFANAFAGMKVEIKNVESSHLTTKPALANNSDILWTTWAQGLWNTKEVMRLTARGRLGINTATPQTQLHVNGQSTFGSVQAAADIANAGYYRVNVTGPNGNAAGPHQTWNNDGDPYPVRQMLNWSHDNTWDTFDCYYDGNTRNSSQSSCFKIFKSATDLVFQSVDTSATTVGSAITPVNRFWINENGQTTFTEQINAQKLIKAGEDVIGNGNLADLLSSAGKMQASPACSCGAGYGGNPMIIAANFNCMEQANACFTGGNGGPIFTPPVRAAGSYFYFLGSATWSSVLQTDRTDMAAPVSFPTGWIIILKSNGAIWEYQGRMTTTEFNAGVTIITSTTNPGKGQNGQQLQTDGNGSLTWVAAGSDRSLKEKVKPLANAEKIINSLVPVEFYWNEKGLKFTGQNNKLHRGLIAQDVEKLLPGATIGTVKILNYNEVTAALIKYVQQLEKRIKKLEAK